ncbi:DUF4440 domain-containing protein [Nocardia sp. CDC159]|uniref:DUF4440 domain-containing protein n=1 Tax=Nocardia pulmonis TaxID=2951408 RepID=A0A9X2E5N9_9NOCA|nr:MULTISPECIES: DUF4440 domain-containing protein [Nocardia]MCM6774125.1 DUF4440 domain-containing protein [Nocardia pulmonis]MCM6787012.1 DUF4440 domain-containing protein [Nocardia sp. CDC159]
MSIDHDTLVEEVSILHDDLASWLGENDAAGLERFGSQLHPDFSMVVLQGAVVPRAQLLEGLRRAGNSMPGLKIDIVDIDVLHRTDDCAVARFREIHHRPDGPASRFTTALLLPDPQARNGLRWRTVHETAAAG